MGRVSHDFQIFVKPAGPLCNLDCHYCYYLGKRGLFPDASCRMTEALLEEYIAQHIEAAPGPVVAFSWHGGEPTLLGLDYFRRAVEFERKHKPPGWRIANGMQTNGLLIDEEWARFFAAEGFSVGLSLDGPAELHDAWRVTKGGAPTHNQAMRAFELLRKHSVPTDVVCVLHNLNVARPLTVYRFFREIGAKYIGFLPVVEPPPGPHSVTPEAYGKFLIRVFDEWIARDSGRIAVQIFEEASRPGRGLEHSLCIYRETCGEIPVVEHNGDFFACDHFVDAGHRFGNITETPLWRLLESPKQTTFGRMKRDALPRCCRECEVLEMCNGGCPKDRFARSAEGEPGLNYLCAGLKNFFTHCRAPLDRLASPKRSPDSGRTGPNGPCPCGSGRKRKHCCGRV